MKRPLMKIRVGIFKPVLLVILASFVACSEQEIVTPDNDPEVLVDDADFIVSDWTVETHSNDADPDFSEVFEDNAVKRLDIVITSARWKSMLADMTSLYGTFGSRNGGGGFSDQDPIFVPAEVFYKGNEWYRVGVRFKGNSSLSSTWSSGNMKLSFKLDFDEFEDDYPQIKNQRFYGFKKLSLKNNYNDKSMYARKWLAIFLEMRAWPVHTLHFIPCMLIMVRDRFILDCIHWWKKQMIP